MNTLKSFILLTLTLVNGYVFSQSQRTINAKLQKAVVYLQGAHLYYSENVNLSIGNNEFTFENISPYIQVATLQASGKGAVIMDVKHVLKYKEKIPVTKRYDREIEQVTDSIEDINYAIKDNANKALVLANEKSMLLNNRIIKGQPLRDSLALLRDGMQFLKDKLNAIYEQELKLERSTGKLTKKLTKLQARYAELINLQTGNADYDQTGNQPTHQVSVVVFSETAGPAQIQFNYFVHQASWVPVYDLQANSTSNNFQLKYFADITQNCGLNWNNVKLTLSTSNPTESNQKPFLSPWYLGYTQHFRQKQLSNAKRPLNMPSATHKSIAQEDMDDVSKDEKYLTEYIQVTENLIRTEYEIKMSYNILSDGKGHKVMISQKEVPMLLEFATVPKICTDAFLMAKVTGWEDMNIIPGNARLYFDGGYVGQMYLNPSTTNDTLDVNLGRDKSIVITRKKIKEKFKSNFIGDERVETRSIEIVVRNTKNIPVDIVIEDQIPVVHGTQEIKVELTDGAGASLDPATGLLRWNKKLGSKDSEKIVFTYEIRYPKGKGIVGL